MTCKENKNGFTLAEVLGVIIILGVVMALAFPSLMRQFQKSEESIEDATYTLIIEATKEYIDSSGTFSNPNTNRVQCIEIATLVANNFLTREQLSSVETPYLYVEVSYDGENYTYDISNDCSTSTSTDLKLNGAGIVNLKIGEVYNELGVIAYDEAGNNVSSIVTSTIYNSNGTIVSSIDTTKTGTYQIKYAYGNQQIEREVKIIDDTAPIIVVESLDERLADTVLTYNLLSKITVTDNSNENITPVVKTNLSLGVPGIYTITITATDSSGNRSEVSKYIEVYSN